MRNALSHQESLFLSVCTWFPMCPSLLFSLSHDDSFEIYIAISFPLRKNFVTNILLKERQSQKMVTLHLLSKVWNLPNGKQNTKQNIFAFLIFHLDYLHLLIKLYSTDTEESIAHSWWNQYHLLLMFQTLFHWNNDNRKPFCCFSQFQPHRFIFHQWYYPFYYFAIKNYSVIRFTFTMWIVHKWIFIFMQRRDWENKKSITRITKQKAIISYTTRRVWYWIQTVKFQENGFFKESF